MLIIYVDLCYLSDFHIRLEYISNVPITYDYEARHATTLIWNIAIFARVGCAPPLCKQATCLLAIRIEGALSSLNKVVHHRVATAIKSKPKPKKDLQLTVLLLYNILMFVPRTLRTVPSYSKRKGQLWKISALLAKINFLLITDEGSVPDMRIWTILLNQSDLKWCTHLSRSLFFIFSTACWVSLQVDQWVPEGTCGKVLRSTSVYL